MAKYRDARTGAYAGAAEDDAARQERKMMARVDSVQRGPVDMPFLLLTLIILAIGVVMVLSASFARAYYEDGDPVKYFSKQLLFAVAGVAAMLVASRVRVRTYWYFTPLILMLSLALLVMVPIIGVGDETGTKRWLYLGFTTFQPSEFSKVAIVFSFAYLICIFKSKMRTFRYGIVPFLVILGAHGGLLYLQPHLSAIIILVAIGGIMMFTGGVRWEWCVGTIVLAGLAGWFLINNMGYAMGRIQAWQDPFSDPTGKGWQTIQSLYSVGSGGLLGLGLGQSRQKYLYLPEEYNDFIFSIVCEELGFIGALLILALFALLIIRGYWLALHARDRFGALVIVGITSHMAIQVVLNIAVVTNLVPCTGISLPFFSYGGTALLVQLAEMGVVLSISRDIPLRKTENRKGDEIADEQ